MGKTFTLTAVNPIIKRHGHTIYREINRSQSLLEAVNLTTTDFHWTFNAGNTKEGYESVIQQ